MREREREREGGREREGERVALTGESANEPGYTWKRGVSLRFT